MSYVGYLPELSDSLYTADISTSSIGKPATYKIVTVGPVLWSNSAKGVRAIDEVTESEVGTTVPILSPDETNAETGRGVGTVTCSTEG